MSYLDWIGTAGQAIFLMSYITFVAHIWRKREAGGVSGLAIAQWLVAYSLLGYYFYVIPNPVFLAYYIAGAVLSLVALEGWRRYR